VQRSTGCAPLCRLLNVRSLLDHFVGTYEQRLWNGEAKRLGGLEIDDQIELGGRLNRKILWLYTSKNAVDIGRRLPIDLGKIHSPRHQAAVAGKGAKSKYRR
jgi:hypothetical protein